MKRSALPAILLFSLGCCYGQEKLPAKFGKITAADFKNKIYSIDSSAEAIVLADIGSSQINGNLKGWFSIEFRHFKRMRILKRNALELANVEIPLYTDGFNEEKLEYLAATTYNFENGKLLTAKLDTKTSVYKRSLNKNHLVKRFAFPAVKEGSIIEFEYTVSSDFIFNLQPWEFQGSYPCLWSEYNVSIPDFFYYVFLQQGKFTKKQTVRQQTFHITNTLSAGATTTEPLVSGVTDYHMVMKNVPAMKEESFTSTIKNHLAKIEFQLKETRQPLPEKTYMESWEDFCKDLLADENFGQQLSRDNAWLTDELINATQGAKTNLEKGRNIYYYIQNTFTCTDHNKLYADLPLKNVLRNKKGSEAEINLLLIAMLRKAGLAADPLMLSTRSHGYVYANYPIIDRFNYVICCAHIDSMVYYLDASHPKLGFGKLNWDCYNGHARIINEEATPVEFSADSITEKKVTSLLLATNDKGEMVGTMQQVPGFFESYFIRNRIKEAGYKNFYSEMENDFTADLEIKNYHIDSLDNPDEQVRITCDVKLNTARDNFIFINPLFGEGYTENPFLSEQRAYPVEMPYALDETYLLRMEIPKEYSVEELPKSTRINFDEAGKSFFEYLIENNDGFISLRSRVKITRSYFLPEEYKLLHDFFSFVAARQNEQIVFKKIK